MRLFLFLTLLVTNSYANDGRHVVISAGAPLAATYTTDARGWVASEIFSLKHLKLTNYTNSPIACLFIGGDPQNILYTQQAPATPPSGREGRELFLAASEQLVLRDFYPSQNLFCRSEGSPVVSGDLFFNAW